MLVRNYVKDMLRSVFTKEFLKRKTNIWTVFSDYHTVRSIWEDFVLLKNADLRINKGLCED